MYSTSKSGSTVLEGELRNHRARPEHIAMHRDVVAEDLGEDPPVLQPPIQHLMTHPHPPLHPPLLRQIRVVSRALDFVHVAAVGWVWKKKGKILTIFCVS